MDYALPWRGAQHYIDTLQRSGYLLKKQLSYETHSLQRLAGNGKDVRWLALIVGLALVIRCTWVLMFQTPPESDPAQYDGLAWRLANGEGFSKADGTPTAYWPVGYPAFLAMIYLLFGHSWLVAGIANAILGSAAVALTYRLAREVLSSSRSLVAAAVIALLPSHIVAFTSVLWSESLHSVLVLITLVVTCRTVRAPSWRNAVLLGFVIGVGLYVRPILLPFPLMLAVLLATREGLSIRKAIGLACMTMAVSLVVIAPWTVRNYVAMGEPVLTSTNGGINLYIGNGPGATGKFRPIEVAGTFSDGSELTVYREAIELTLGHMLRNPLKWLATLPHKFFYLWASDANNIDPHIVPDAYRSSIPFLFILAQLYWMLIALAAIAALFTRSIRGYWLQQQALLLPLTLVYWTVFYLMFFGGGRFHMPVVPVVVIIGVHLMDKDRDWKAWIRTIRRGILNVVLGTCSDDTTPSECIGNHRPRPCGKCGLRGPGASGRDL